MNDYIHDKVVKWFYDHEELLLAIMNKTPYQSDGWDYEIEVVKEFLATNQSCYCGDIYNLGVIHRDDGPCHYPEHTSEYKRGYADAMNWKVQNNLEHLPAAQQSNEQVEPVKFPRNVQEYAEDWIIDPAFLTRVKHSIDPETPWDFTPTMEQVEVTLLALEVIPSALFAHPPVPTAQPEQEPVAWAESDEDGEIKWGQELCFSDDPEWLDNPIPLYTTPPQRKPLTNVELEKMARRYQWWLPFARAVEDRHGIKGDA